MRNAELLLIALVVISTLYLISCRVKEDPLPESPGSPQLRFDVREIEMELKMGIFEAADNSIIYSADSGNVVVTTSIHHSFENPAQLPTDSAAVWFFAVPRELVQNFDPIQNPGAPSLLAINVSTTDKKLVRQAGAEKFTPCGTITTVKPVTKPSFTLYHVINDYGDLMLVESDSIRTPWAKIIADDLAITRQGSPWKSSATINMNNRMLKYNECVKDTAWKWVND